MDYNVYMSRGACTYFRCFDCWPAKFGEVHTFWNWWFPSTLGSGRAYNYRPRCCQAQLWTFWRFCLPVCSTSANRLHSHQRLLVDKSRRCDLGPCIHMVVNRCDRVCFLWPKPQHTAARSLCTCSSRRRDIPELSTHFSVVPRPRWPSENRCFHL
nr:cationic amino acid transporter 2, vacuolar-like isoform X3 [Ipomoea batatas]